MSKKKPTPKVVTNTPADYETLYKDLWEGVAAIVVDERNSLRAALRAHLVDLLGAGLEANAVSQTVIGLTSKEGKG